MSDVRSPLAVRADGQVHAVVGVPCFDSVRVTVIDARRTEEVDLRHGKVVGRSSMTVSVDSRSATLEWSESCNANDSLTSGTDSLMRVKSGPAGSHAISGSWVVARRLSLSSNALVITLKLTPGTFSFADPTGQSYVARLDGARTTIQGDLSRTAVSVRRLDARTLEEVDSHGGKIDEVVRYVLVNDSTMTISTENKEQGSLRRFPAHKQSRP